MKKITLVIDENLYNALGLTNGSDEAAIATAIKNMAGKAQKVDELTETVNTLTAAKTAAETNLATFQKNAKTEKVKTILANALKENKLTKEASDALEADYAENPEGLEKVVNTLKAYTPITPGLTPPAEPKNKAELVKEYDEAFENGTLSDIQNSNPDHFAALKEAKFGKK